MEKNLVIFLTPLEGPLIDAQASLKTETEYEILEVRAVDAKKELTADHFPCAVMASSAKESIIFLTQYKDILAKSKSKFVLAYPQAIDSRIERQLYGLGAFDVVAEKNLNPKTLVHKAKLAIKTLPKMDEEKIKSLRIERLVTDQELGNIDLHKKSEIDYETIDFMALEKACHHCIRYCNELEKGLGEYEVSGLKSHIKEIDKLFGKMATEAKKNNLEILGQLITIPEFIAKTILQTSDENFASILGGVLINSVDLLRAEFESLKEKRPRKMIYENPHRGLYERYRWLADKFDEFNIENSISEVMENLKI